jgi:hypothetical protein
MEEPMIDRGAPVEAKGLVDIEATEVLVWEVLTDLERWPQWNPEVKSVSVAGPVAPGMEFRWSTRFWEGTVPVTGTRLRASAGTITSRFQEVERPKLLGWTGRLSPLGIEAVHVWKLEAHNGRTRVLTEESWSGLAVKFLRGPARSMLQQSINRGLEALKSECERRVGGEGAERLPQED